MRSRPPSRVPDAKVVFQDLLVAKPAVGDVYGLGDLAVIDEIEAGAEQQQEIDVLLDDQELDPRVGDILDRDSKNLLEFGREAERWLVKDHQARTGHQAHADIKHLPLAARQRAALLRTPLGKSGKEVEHKVAVAHLGGTGTLSESSERQRLPYGHASEQKIALSHMDEATLNDVRGRRGGDVGSFEYHASSGRAYQAGERFKEGGLAMTVRPEEPDTFAALDMERDAA